MKTTTRKLEDARPGVAPILQEAPRVSSGKREKVHPFQALLDRGRRAGSKFVLKRGKKSAKLFWPSLELSRAELAGLLQRIPRGRRVDGAVRAGSETTSLSFDGKLRRSSLDAPSKTGLLLYWTEPPESLGILEQESRRRKPAPAKESEPAAERPEPAAGGEAVDLLMESPRFLAAYQALKSRPPTVTVSQILKLLWNSGGQAPLTAIKERIGLPDKRLDEILSQMDALLKGGGEFSLSLSLDGTTLLLHRDVLGKLFSLEASSSQNALIVRADTVDGRSREVKLPVEVSVKERRVLEALLRYGKLSEGELSQIVGSRRVGGLLERLVSQLEGAGYYGLSVVGEGDGGRVYGIG